MRTLFILRGAPASGKSTWVTQNKLEPYTISTDTLRLMYQSPVTTNEGELAISQNHDKEVWGMVMELLERRMVNGEFVVVDATHYKSPLINRYKNLVSKYRYRVFVVDFSNISEIELKKRNATRGFRRVPDEVIEKMVVALKDDSEVKKAYKIITPSEASSMVNSPLVPFKADELFDKVVIFGDIHGCYEPLKQYFERNPFDEKTNYIFCGDYLDRGIQNKEVLEFLISLKENKNCVFLEGNHEKWLKLYAQKDYNMEDYEHRPNIYKDPFVTKLIAQLKDRQTTLEKQINKNKNMSEELSKLLRESWETDTENREVYYKFEKINVPEKQKELHKDINKYEHQLEVLKSYLFTLRHEEFNTANTIALCKMWFNEEFSTDLSMDITNILEKNYNMESIRRQNPIKSAEFIKRTYPQIKGIDKTEIRRFCDRLSQMSYFEFCGMTCLVTHGGLPNLPTIKTQSIEMIKGVGKYEDSEEIAKRFTSNTSGNVFQIHGHRNIMKVPIWDGTTRTMNLEGNIEFGGGLRYVVLEKGQDGSIVLNIYEEPNTVYAPIEEEVQDVKTDLERLKEMYDSRWVQVKELNDNVVSFNFTRDAFEKGKWDSITCHARGLFVDKTDGTVVGRSFSKFFNYNEVDETKSEYLKEHFAYPVIGYDKENGFLGIISKSKGKVRIFTKSSDEGDYVNWFIGVLCDNYGIKANYVDTQLKYSDLYNQFNSFKGEFAHNKKEKGDTIDPLYLSHGENIIKDVTYALSEAKNSLLEKLSSLIVEGKSYVFECIDKTNDPHIIKYLKNQLFLLEVFDNKLEESHIPYDELVVVAKELGVKPKRKSLVFNTWEEFETWKNRFRQGVTQWESREEGYVFEDQNGYRVKFKSSYYSFWKQMRSIKERLQSGKQNLKTYKTKEEIQAVKLMEEIDKAKLKTMSIIDIEDLFYQKYPMPVVKAEDTKEVVTV